MTAGLFYYFRPLGPKEGGGRAKKYKPRHPGPRGSGELGEAYAKLTLAGINFTELDELWDMIGCERTANIEEDANFKTNGSHRL